MFINKITNVKNMGSYFIEFKNTVSQEQDGEHGLSHLVEHCMCEQIKKFDNKFQEYGISWNACTSASAVFYFMTGLIKNIKKYIPDFTKNILDYKISKDVFERERKIVISEYLMYYNDESERFSQNWFRNHYNYTSELGLLSDLQNITYEKFMEFKNRVFSNPSNIIFVHPKNIADLKDIQDYNISFNDNKIESYYSKFNLDKYTDYPTEYYNSGISEQRIIMFGQNLEVSKYDFYKVNALCSLFNYFMSHGLSSYLYQEIREKTGYTYAISTFGHCFNDYNTIFVGFSCETNNDHVEKLIKTIQKSMKKLLKHIKERKFNSIYKSFKTKYMIQSNTDYSSYSYFCDEDTKIIMQYLLDKQISFDEFKQFAENFVENYHIYNDIDYIK